MAGFNSIKRVSLPEKCLKLAYDHMRSMGSLEMEGVALFVGKIEGDTFDITETLIPKQECTSLEEGLSYSVDSDELYRINLYLFRAQLRLFAQIHSHPHEAFHSETDDQYPIMTTVGGLSIVVPDFATGSMDIENWAVFRLVQQNEWSELNARERKMMLNLT